MEKYIKDLTTIIRDCNMENTYKMSWVRSLVESYNYKLFNDKNLDYVVLMLKQKFESSEGIF